MNKTKNIKTYLTQHIDHIDIVTVIMENISFDEKSLKMF